MTKEELEKYTVDFMNNETGFNTSKINSILGKMLIRYAEIFQKQIQIDAEQIRALQKQNGELTDKVKELEDKLANADYQLEGRDNEIRELEAQVEKMKCCTNCRKFNNLSYDCTCAEVCNEWELRR